MRKKPFVATVVISVVFMCLAGCEKLSISDSSLIGSSDTVPSSTLPTTDITTDTSTNPTTSTPQEEKSYFEVLSPNKPSLVTDTDKTMKIAITNENASHSTTDSTESDSTTSDTSTNASTTSNTSLKSYYSPSEVTVPKTITDYGYENFADWHYTPSLGNVPLLVIPIVIPTFEDEATEENMNLIKRAFAGDGLNYESLYSYYYQSSYGQLSFDITVTDYFVMSKNSTMRRKKKFEEDTGNVTKVCKEALAFMTKKYDLDLTQYDSDKDGCLDGAWFIYIARTYTPYNKASQNFYWGFTTTTMEVGTVESPVLNTYGWAGIDFLDGTNVTYNLSKEDNPDSECDAHVLIHETGHMLGLSDYYSYASSEYSPLGKIDMMDNNVGDHNPFSKILLGWIKPYVVTGTSATITLDTSLSKDSVILISYDDKQYKLDEDGKLILNIFDEYILVDYYSPNGLNKNGYTSYGVSSVQEYGCRVYHVDNRLVALHKDRLDPLTGEYTYSSIEMPYNVDEFANGDYGDRVEWYKIISNTESGENSESYRIGKYISEISSYFDEIRWISADGKKLDKKHDNANRLFGTGTSFSLDDFSSQFYNGKLDNEKTFSSIVTFG